MMSFVKVVENVGFSAAARHLDISPSLVTTHVKSLEDELGVLLLNRSTRKVSLTEIGRSYYERCVQILAEIEEANEIAQASQVKPRGILRLNVAQAIPPLLAPSMAEFVARYPEVSVRLTVTSRMVDIIEEGYDLAIRTSPVRDSSLIARHLGTYRMVVCGAPSYFERRGCPQSPAELAKHNCMLFYDSLWGGDWHFSGPDGEHPVHVGGDLETNSVVTLRSAALLGQGLICAPLFMVASDLRSRALVPILTDFMPFEFSVDAIYPHRRYVSAKVRYFIDLVGKHFRQENWVDTAAFRAAPAAPCRSSAKPEFALTKNGAAQ
jgi:DNA-binding transcriptional LysR family regulator